LTESSVTMPGAFDPRLHRRLPALPRWSARAQAGRGRPWGPGFKSRAPDQFL